MNKRVYAYLALANVLYWIGFWVFMKFFSP